MTGTARAWLLDVGADWRVAAGAHHVVEYLLSPQTVSLPLAAPHCPGVLIWREQMVPMVDLERLLPGRAAPARERAVILAYQEAPGAPLRYGALHVQAAPTEVWASDDLACPLPEEPAAIRQFSRSCFTCQDRPVPILDVARLFSRPLAWTAPRTVRDPIDAAAQEGAVVVTGAPQAAASDVPVPAPALDSVETEARAEEPVRAVVPEPVATAREAGPDVCLTVPAHRGELAPSPDAALPGEPVSAALPVEIEPIGPTDDEFPEPATVVPARARAASAFSDSLARSRALQRKRPAARRRLSRLLLTVAGVALGLLATLLFMNCAGLVSTPDVPTQEAPAVRDVTPGKVEPYSAPATPTRPPS